MPKSFCELPLGFPIKLYGIFLVSSTRTTFIFHLHVILFLYHKTKDIYIVTSLLCSILANFKYSHAKYQKAMYFH